MKLATLTLLISVILTPAARAGSFSEIYVFGDSFSDSGNAFAATGGLIPSDPPYFQGRFSNGPVWAERLAELLGLTLVANGPDPEVVIGNNFAVAGSRAAEDVPVLFLGTIPSVATQVEFFTSALPVVPADALYVIFSSHDDLRGATDPAEALNEPQRRQRARAAVDAITTAVGRLAAAGATTFLIPNSVDLGRTPESGVFGNSATLTQLVGFYNLALNVALAESEKTLGVTIVQADMFAFGEQVVDDALNNNGGVFGLTNIDVPILEGVAGSPGAPAETSLFFDDLHPSAVAHTLLGEFAFAAVQTALGSGEGGQLPGDCNQDGQLDISDGICTLGILFLGDPARFPCGDGTSSDAANLALGDFNNDGRLDISDGVASFNFLFNGDALPHPLGTDCVAIAGCPERCTLGR